MKTTDVIFSHAADELTLNDLNSAVCSAAKQDARFSAGGTKGDYCPWCVDILRDEDVDSWSAVIQGCDGKMYEVPFTISEDNGSITLGTSAIPVNRKTAYVAASEKGFYFYNGEVVKGGGPGSGRKSGESFKTESSSGEEHFHGSEEEAKSHFASQYPKAEIGDYEPNGEGQERALVWRNAKDSENDDGSNAVGQIVKIKTMSKMKSRFKISAAGTTDGASKGHAAKKSTMANDASADAHEASQTAHESDDADDHNAAKDAHEAASEAHSTAMLAHAKVNNEEEAGDHAKMMAAHDACADAHCRSDSDAVAASLKQLGFTIKAKQPEILHCRDQGTQIAPATAWKQGQEVKFMYMPGGISTITAGFRDKAINITVEVDEDTANTVQASFDNLKSSAPKQKPFGDIEHKEEEASVHPTRFEWGNYDDIDGVLVAAEPTALGERNVNGKIHRSWSPSFTTDADYSKAKEKGGVYTFPEGIRGSASNPARITGIDFCIGTLTNKPAFQNMPPVKAKKHNGNEQAKKLTAADVLKQICPPLKTERVMSIKDVFRQLNGQPVKAKDEQSDADKKTALADEASKVAHDASSDAHESDDSKDHDQAAALHEKASKAHATAMIASKKEGDDDKADEHAKMMVGHDAMAEAHSSHDCEKVEACMKKYRQSKTISIETVFAQLSKTGSPTT